MTRLAAEVATSSMGFSLSCFTIVITSGPVAPTNIESKVVTPPPAIMPLLVRVLFGKSFPAQADVSINTPSISRKTSVGSATTTCPPMTAPKIQPTKK